MKKLVWRVKLVADFGDEAAEIEVEVARIERDEFTVPALGLSLAEGKHLTAAIKGKWSAHRRRRWASASVAARIADRSCSARDTGPSRFDPSLVTRPFEFGGS